MKELSIEQKAKAYDEAIEKAKSKIKNDKDHVLYEEDITDIFPELTESEDESIRKAMINYFTNGKEYLSLTPYSKEDYIAWLKKHGEQKSTVETKLKIEEGKWYICISQFCNCIEGKVYKCNESYTIPCNNGRNISQWRLIGVEDMFKLINDKGE